MYELNENRLDMSDTERILEIIKVKNLNNIQFCSATGISPASLSHITSNRSKPTLSILRNVIAGFPDINPEWVMMGTGSMFREGVSSSKPDSETGGQEASRTRPDSERMNSLFPMGDDGAAQQKPDRRGRKDSDGDGMQLSNAAIEAVVASTLKKMRQEKRVVEVRVFYDDETYEVFRKE